MSLTFSEWLHKHINVKKVVEWDVMENGTMWIKWVINGISKLVN